MKDAASILRKWVTNAGSGASATNWKEGVSRVVVSPTHKAAQKLDKYLSSVNEAVSSGRMRESLMSVDTPQWQDACQRKAANFTTGIKAGEAKMQRFLTNFLPMQQQVTDRVNQMPDGTLEERIAKSAEQARQTASLKGKWRGRF
jgi:hypothetical protein